MDAFKKVMDDLKWLLCSTDKDITIPAVHTAAIVELSNMKTPEDIQEAMNLFVRTVLRDSRYVNEYGCYKLVRSLYRDMVSKGAKFPTEYLFEFDCDGTVEDCIQDMPSRVCLLFASGNDLDWMRNVESVYWEDVMDETPKKELLMKCLKWYVEKYSHMLLW